MDMTFIPNPAAPIIVSAISTDTGMELPTIREAFTFPKNTKSTIIERITAMIKVSNTLFIAALISSALS